MAERRRSWTRGALFTAGLLLAGCGGGGHSPTASSDPTPPSPSPPGAPSAVVELTTSNFEELVSNSRGVCLVEFYSPSCPHCRQMEPVVEQLAADFAGRALVGRVNVDRERPLLPAWGIGAWPTFVVVDGGREVGRWVGVTSYEHLAGMLGAALEGR